MNLANPAPANSQYDIIQSPVNLRNEFVLP